MNGEKKFLRAAIFDLDGTLLDSMGLWQDVDREFFGKRGIVMPEDYSTVVAPMGFPAAAAYTKRHFGLPDDEASIMAEWNAMAMEAYALHVDAKPFAYEYLSFLAEKGIAVCAATASHTEFWEPALVRLGLLPFFSSVTEIKEVSRGKGFPDIYLRASEKLGIPPEACAVFEDIPEGVRGARAGGFYTVGVYDAHNGCEDTLSALCDRYIHSFSELIAEDVFG